MTGKEPNRVILLLATLVVSPLLIQDDCPAPKPILAAPEQI